MINKAFVFAFKVHGEQKRKDGSPYISHPVEVAFELAKNGASDELICAGLLHDTIEDAGVTTEILEKEFSSAVVDLVTSDSENKSLSWEERKKLTLEILNSKDCSRELKMLVCADKLANIRSINRDLEKMGDDVWSLFRRGKDKQQWLFESLVLALSDLEGLPMYSEFKETVNTIFYK